MEIVEAAELKRLFRQRPDIRAAMFMLDAQARQAFLLGRALDDLYRWQWVEPVAKVDRFLEQWGRVHLTDAGRRVWAAAREIA